MACENCERKESLIARLRGRIIDLKRENDELRSQLEEHGHSAIFTPYGWSVHHPVECRSKPGLLCDISEALEKLPANPLPPGIYPVALDAKGELVFEASPDIEVKGAPVA